MFKKILIANRGEIAVRIIKACRELNIIAVVVYSEVDRDSLHVQEADEAVCIGNAPAVESYLNMNAVIQAAKKTSSEAIHPGYGFLAENANFAALCEKENIVFIGPNSKSMNLVGDKIRSRKTMEAAGIPIIPGMEGSSEDITEYKKEASKIGYPVMVKASAGGGGKGMRIVRSPNDLVSSLEAGKREAKAAFGDDSVYLEKYIEEPRHVEFQVVADNFGNRIHLFERECSIQRRHQKIIEESPSTALNSELRKKMGAAAKKVIEVSEYNNAGTVEFLLDKNGNYYFLEVNARLQVEHPVTEFVTGIDLVQMQLSIASGEKLSLNQEQIRQKGHSIECRIYAEDPAKNFLPSSGKILFLKEPTGPGIRHDCGIYTGGDVPIYYDPILAKLIVWSESRKKACFRMSHALNDYVVIGVETTIDFLKEIIGHSEFISGKTTTNFIQQHFDGWTIKKNKNENKKIALLASALDSMRIGYTLKENKIQEKDSYSPWRTLGKWRLGGEN
ncbi:MAG: acetyl-CoA carboxylase biotin carboxylase subunit [Candidatus Aminicenantaceae bacterium]